jgi:hypothetical protein
MLEASVTIDGVGTTLPVLVPVLVFAPTLPPVATFVDESPLPPPQPASARPAINAARTACFYMVKIPALVVLNMMCFLNELKRNPDLAITSGSW